MFLGIKNKIQIKTKISDKYIKFLFFSLNKIIPRIKILITINKTKVKESTTKNKPLQEILLNKNKENIIKKRKK